jgi:hypothetical protein
MTTPDRATPDGWTVLRVSDDYYLGITWHAPKGEGKPYGDEADVLVPTDMAKIGKALQKAYEAYQRMIGELYHDVERRDRT